MFRNGPSESSIGIALKENGMTVIAGFPFAEHIPELKDLRSSLFQGPAGSFMWFRVRFFLLFPKLLFENNTARLQGTEHDLCSGASTLDTG